jgi:SAM-dependent methyltransferase
MRHEPRHWYDLPRYYDAVYSDTTGEEARFLSDVFARYGPGRVGKVLEPACGTGRIVHALARRGHEVTGFDVNEKMLAVARRRAARCGARILAMDMAGFAIGDRFDAACCGVSSFRHLASEGAAVGHLRCVADHLEPGGVYVLGLHLTEYGDRGFRHERLVGTSGRAEVVLNTRIFPADRSRRLQRLRSRLSVAQGGRVERYEATWWLRTYDARELAATIRASGRFSHVATFDYDYDAGKAVELDGDRLDRVVVLVNQR